MTIIFFRLLRGIGFFETFVTTENFCQRFLKRPVNTPNPLIISHLVSVDNQIDERCDVILKCDRSQSSPSVKNVA